MPVYKSDNGTWYVLTRYLDWKGERKQKCKRGFETRKEAVEWERTFQQQNAADMDMTFEAFFELYANDIKPRLKENTWLTKEHIVETKIMPYFAKRIISEITTKDVMAWQNELLAYRDENRKPYSQTYLKTVHNQLSAIFNHAVRHYDLRSNPASKAGNMGTEERKEMKFWTKDEYKKFADNEYLDQMIAAETVSLKGLKPDAKVFDEMIMDVNTEYFEKNGGYDFACRFYEEAFRFAEKIYGKDNIISAVMHADELNVAMTEKYGRPIYHYHLHIMALPVVDKEVRWSKRCKSPELVGTVKEVIHQVSHSKKWRSEKALDEDGNPILNSKGKQVYHASYSVLQDKFYEHVQSALDLIMTAKYEVGTNLIAIEKSAVADDFFILSRGLAGEMLEKFITYQAKLAIFGDYSHYTSKPLKDFIYESNKGKDVFFVATQDEALERLTR